MSKKPIYLFLVSLAICLTFSLNAFAIRSVGNGGGLAEMRVIYLFQNLNHFLQICLTESNECQISNLTRSEWKLAAEKNEDYEVSFVTEPLNEKGYSTNGLKMQISHLALYSDLKTPNMFYELLAFVIAVQQDVQGSQMAFKENIKVAKSVFKKLKIDESSSKVLGISTLLKLNQLKVSDGTSDHLIFGLEDESKTINLSKAMTQALPCGTLAQWTFNQWSNVLVSSAAYFYGNASATCDGHFINRKIMIKASLTNELLIDESKINVGFYAN